MAKNKNLRKDIGKATAAVDGSQSMLMGSAFPVVNEFGSLTKPDLISTIQDGPTLNDWKGVTNDPIDNDAQLETPLVMELHKPVQTLTPEVVLPTVFNPSDPGPKIAVVDPTIQLKPIFTAAPVGGEDGANIKQVLPMQADDNTPATASPFHGRYWWAWYLAAIIIIILYLKIRK